jgi:hypothetical protein
MVTLKCQECGKEYEVLDCRQWTNKKYGKEQRKYCSTKCQYKSQRKFWNSPEERKRRSERAIGYKNGRWKGGLRKIMGYVWVYFPDSHLHKVQGAIPRAVYVMEQHIGRRLRKEEVVHHMNGKRTDDRIENLLLFPNSAEHIRWHGKRRTKKEMDHMRSFISYNRQEDILDKGALYG